MQRKHASDCTHYCTPGPVDTWVDVLMKAIVKSCQIEMQPLVL